jgi:hypothetical protein
VVEEQDSVQYQSVVEEEVAGRGQSLGRVRVHVQVEEAHGVGAAGHDIHGVELHEAVSELVRLALQQRRAVVPAQVGAPTVTFDQCAR